MAVVSANTAAQHRRSEMSQKCHPGDYRQNQPLVKSMTALSEKLFATPPAKKQFMTVQKAGNIGQSAREQNRRRTKF